MDTEKAADVNLAHYLQLVWKRLWLVILTAAIAAGGAFLVSNSSTPIYEASATLLIRESRLDTSLDYNSVLMSERLAMTYSQMLKDAPVLDEVIARLSLDMSEQALARTITVENVRDTLLINLRVRDPDPVLAADIANMVAQVFTEQHEQIAAARYSSSLESLRGEMQQLEGQIRAGQVALDAVHAQPTPESAELARLETMVAQYRSSYAELLRSYEEMRVAEAGSSEAIIITKPAKVPDEPVLPRKGLNTVLAGALGATLALGGAFLLDYLDDSVRDEDDVQSVAELPTLASIWRFDRSQSSEGVPLMKAHPGSPAAEAYRLLRTNFQFSTLGMGGSATTVVVSSAALHEGKTTTVANLGISLAQIGKQVLLVDTDLRRPALHTHFGLSNSIGLTSLLLQQKPNPESAIRRTGVEGLYVLPSGPVPANPAELLEHPHFDSTLARLKELADYLILDSPPVLSVADASILAQKAEGVLLVAQQNRTRRETLRAAAVRLREIEVRVLGVVLNQVNRKASRYYGYYEKSSEPSPLARAEVTRQTQDRSSQRPVASEPQATAEKSEPSPQAEPEHAAPEESAPEPRVRGSPWRSAWLRVRGSLWRSAWLRAVLAGLFTVAAALFTCARWGDLRDRISAILEGDGSESSSRVTFEAAALGHILSMVGLVSRDQPPPTPSGAVEGPRFEAGEPALPAEHGTPTPGLALIPTPQILPATRVGNGTRALAASLSLRDGLSQCAAGEPVFFVLAIENASDEPAGVGMIELRVSDNGAFRTPWTDVVIEPGKAFHAEYYLIFHSAATYTVTEAVCYGTEGTCELGDAEWEEASPSVIVNIT